jgi:hypothetical protein
MEDEAGQVGRVDQDVGSEGDTGAEQVDLAGWNQRSS